MHMVLEANSGLPTRVNMPVEIIALTASWASRSSLMSSSVLSCFFGLLWLFLGDPPPSWRACSRLWLFSNWTISSTFVRCNGSRPSCTAKHLLGFSGGTTEVLPS